MILYGAIFSEEELIKAIGHDCIAKYCLENDCEINMWDAVVIYRKNNEGFFATDIATAGKPACVIGRPYHLMGMDETRAQFEKTVKDKVGSIVEGVECFMMEIENDKF